MIITSNPTTIFVGLEPPKLLSPDIKKINYDIKPLIKWSKSIGADIYELYINDKLLYEGTKLEFKIPYNLDLGINKIIIVAKNDFQRSKSDIFNLNIIKISPSKPLTPVNNEKIYLYATDKEYNFTWEKKYDDSIYELIIDYEKIYKGKKNNIKINIKDNEKFFSPGKHTLYIITEKYNQSITSKTINYFCIEKMGMKFGIIAGANIARPSIKADDKGRSTKGTFGGGSGIFIDYLSPLLKSFELHFVLEIFYDYRNTSLPHYDWRPLEATNGEMIYLDFNQHWLYIPLMIKPSFSKGNFNFYGLLGASLDIYLGGRIKNNPDNFYNINTLKPKNNFGVSIPVSLGFNYTTDKKLWHKTKINFGLELRYYQSITKEISDFQNANSYYGSLFNMELMLLFSTVLLDI